jgi:unsaturated rhamnogalacturonyl hydrolase
MKWWILLFCFGPLFAQSDEEVLRRVADNILKQPVDQFIGVQSGKVYTSLNGVNEDLKFASPLMEWHYSNGVLDMSMLKLGRTLKEKKYSEYAYNHVESGFKNGPYFQSTFKGDRRHWHWPYGQWWNFKELDDCGAMGAAVISVYAEEPKEEYLKYAERAAKHILYDQDRLEDGTLARTAPRNLTVWADDMYMSVSFLTQMGRVSKEQIYLDAAVKQVLQMTEYLWDPQKELFYHCYYADLKRNGVAFWGRANGWICTSIILLLEVLPENHSDRPKLIQWLDKQIVGASRYQAGSGMWRQLLDKEDAYEESSVTAMYTYAIAKGVKKGWLDPKYSSIAFSAWEALKKNQITTEGHFKNVCVGTGISDALSFYYNRPVGENEKHGLGLVLEAGMAIMELKSK